MSNFLKDDERISSASSSMIGYTFVCSKHGKPFSSYILIKKINK